MKATSTTPPPPPPPAKGVTNERAIDDIKLAHVEEWVHDREAFIEAVRRAASGEIGPD